MNTFSMTCSCGDKMDFTAETRQEALTQAKAMMTQTTIDAHMAEKHPGMTMTQADCHAMIEKDLVQV